MVFLQSQLSLPWRAESRRASWLPPSFSSSAGQVGCRARSAGTSFAGPRNSRKLRSDKYSLSTQAASLNKQRTWIELELDGAGVREMSQFDLMVCLFNLYIFIHIYTDYCPQVLALKKDPHRKHVGLEEAKMRVPKAHTAPDSLDPLGFPDPLISMLDSFGAWYTMLNMIII